jgi:hypothetical protein
VLREPTKHHVAGLGRDGHHRSPNRGAGRLPGLEPPLSGSWVTTSIDIRQAETIDKQQQAVSEYAGGGGDITGRSSLELAKPVGNRCPHWRW